MIKTRTVLCLLTILLFLMVSSFAHAQRGARTVTRGLDQLVQEADLIVRGSVVSARVEPHPQLTNLMTVVISMRVDSTLKGAPAKTLEFRQYIWDYRDTIDAARYKRKEELLLMLGPVSPYGLRSPVGLEQGRFHIVRTPNQPATAMNSLGNVGLLDSTAQRVKAQSPKFSARTNALLQQKPQGALPLADLEEAVKNLAGVSR